MENNKDEFLTRDFYLAAFLRAKDIRLIKATKKNKITSFHFSNTDNLDELIRNFYNDSEMVSANKFINSIRNLRAYSYNIKNTI